MRRGQTCVPYSKWSTDYVASWAVVDGLGNGSGKQLHRPPSRDDAAIEFRRSTRSFGSVRAVDDVSLEVAAGEFFSMLDLSGPARPRAEARRRL